MGKLDGKIALVTGGNSGIGLATAKLFKQEGATVIITARSAETFGRATSEYGKQFDVIQANISKLTDVKSLLAQIASRHKKLDIVFANAGLAEPKPTELVNEDEFDRLFDTNVKGLYFTVQQAIPLLQNGSSIILNASVVAGMGLPGMSVYSATKAAVRSFGRTWAAELASRAIRVNVLSPGPIETPIFTKMGLTEKEIEDFSAMAKQSPLGRFGRPEEMAATVLFLASDDSSYITGIDLVAAGGMGTL